MTSGCRRRGRPRRSRPRSRPAVFRRARSTSTRRSSAAVSAGAARRDFVTDAVETSKAVGKPVKVVWTREDDMQHDFYRPVTYVRMWGAVDGSGKPVAFMQRLVQQSLMKRIGGLPPNGIDFISLDGAASLPYDIPNIRVEYTETDPGIPFGFWRSVGASVNGFVVEAFVDELAAAAGEDPFEFRRDEAEQTPAPQGGARAGRREVRLGQAAAAGARARDRADGMFRQHRRAGGGGVGHQRQRARAQGLVRGRLRVGDSLPTRSRRRWKAAPCTA